MKSLNVTHMQSVDKNEIFFVSEHAVQTVTSKIQNFKEANKNKHIRVSQRLKYNSYTRRSFIAPKSRTDTCKRNGVVRKHN